MGSHRSPSLWGAQAALWLVPWRRGQAQRKIGKAAVRTAHAQRLRRLPKQPAARHPDHPSGHAPTVANPNATATSAPKARIRCHADAVQAKDVLVASIEREVAPADRTWTTAPLETNLDAPRRKLTVETIPPLAATQPSTIHP